jgi:hypothetical protein
MPREWSACGRLAAKAKLLLGKADAHEHELGLGIHQGAHVGDVGDCAVVGVRRYEHSLGVLKERVAWTTTVHGALDDSLPHDRNIVLPEGGRWWGSPSNGSSIDRLSVGARSDLGDVGQIGHRAARCRRSA